MAKLLIDVRNEQLGSGMYLAAGTEVQIMRWEEDKPVIRGAGYYYCSNPNKQPVPNSVTMIVTLNTLEISEVERHVGRSVIIGNRKSQIIIHDETVPQVYDVYCFVKNGDRWRLTQEKSHALELAAAIEYRDSWVNKIC